MTPAEIEQLTTTRRAAHRAQEAEMAVMRLRRARGVYGRLPYVRATWGNVWG